jgi:hypothetical protein
LCNHIDAIVVYYPMIAALKTVRCTAEGAHELNLVCSPVRD